MVSVRFTLHPNLVEMSNIFFCERGSNSHMYRWCMSTHIFRENRSRNKIVIRDNKTMSCLMGKTSNLNATTKFFCYSFEFLSNQCKTLPSIRTHVTVIRN